MSCLVLPPSFFQPQYLPILPTFLSPLFFPPFSLYPLSLPHSCQEMRSSAQSHPSTLMIFTTTVPQAMKPVRHGLNYLKWSLELLLSLGYLTWKVSSVGWQTLHSALTSDSSLALSKALGEHFLQDFSVACCQLSAPGRSYDGFPLILCLQRREMASRESVSFLDLHFLFCAGVWGGSWSR